LLSGVCQPCAVTCSSPDPVVCGTALQTALAALNDGETLHVCPGRYQGGFTLAAAATVIGAGEGGAPGSNTILDANELGRVLEIADSVGTVELERLRLTGANSAGDGGGIRHQGTTLRMTECTVIDNTSSNGSGVGIAVFPGRTLQMLRCTVRDNEGTGTSFGGGISSVGTTTLTDCVIEDNRSHLHGGGLYVGTGTTTLAGTTQVRLNRAGAIGGGVLVNPGGTLIISEASRVTENTAPSPGDGGGIYNSGGTVTLQGTADPSPIVVNNCHENCAGPSAVPKCSTEPPASC
jgi:hypothetical protein